MIVAPAPSKVFNNSEAWRALFAPLAREVLEVAAIAYLGPQWQLLGLRHLRSGRCESVDVPIRAIAADALAFDAAGVVMAHNHPSGDARFSAVDLAISRRLARALDALGIRFLDHLLLTRDDWTSLKAQALL